MRSLLALVMLFTLSAGAQVVEPRAEFKQMAQEMVTDLRIQLATVPGAKLKQEILTLVFEAADEEERPVDEIFVDEINKLEIRSIADLDKLQPLLAASLQRLSAE